MSIVAVLQGVSETDATTVQSALAIAQHMKLPLTGLFALPDPQSALMLVSSPESPGLSAAAAANLIGLQKEMLAAARDAFQSVTGTGTRGLDSQFRHEIAPVGRAAESAATLAEALVFPRSAAKAGEPLSVAFDHVMMDARLPVLLAGAAPFVPGPVIIGWDGSNGAARAVRLHDRLITALGDVIIAQGQKDAERDGVRPEADPGALANWLKSRGVSPRQESLDGDVGASLLSLASRTGATLIVAGAYGHSRLGERLFGGTSRHLLDAKTAPALALAR